MVEIFPIKSRFPIHVHISFYVSRFLNSSRDLSSQLEIFFFMSGCSNSSRHFSIQGAGRDVTQDSFLAFSAKDKNLKMT